MTLENAVGQDKPVVRWGGLAGIGGGLLFIAVFVIVIVFAGPDPGGIGEPIKKFPEIRYVRTVENGLYLAVIVLWMAFYLGLYRVLKLSRPASASFGCGASIVGLGILAASAIPHIATSRLSDLYHASTATADDRATLVIAWQATQGLFDAMLLAGLLFLALGVVAVGVSMAASPAFGKVSGSVAVVLGLCGVGAGIAMLIDPKSPAPALGFFALIAFHLIAGWKTWRVK